MDSNMYAVMRYDWSGSNQMWGGDSVMAVAMSLDAANRFMEGWSDPDGELTPRDSLQKRDDHGGLWRFFINAETDDRATLRVDRVPLV